MMNATRHLCLFDVRHTLTPPIFQSIRPTPLGDVVLAATEDGLAGVWFEQRQQHLPDRSTWQRDDTHPALVAAAQQLAEYFSGQRRTFDLPLQPAWGTPFQRAVWLTLQRIPFGQTCTYGDIAHQLGQPNAVRAVGAAIGRNPLIVVVPCHRVVGAKGALTGYAGGLDRKTFLLAFESAQAPLAP